MLCVLHCHSCKHVLINNGHTSFVGYIVFFFQYNESSVLCLPTGRCWRGLGSNPAGVRFDPEALGFHLQDPTCINACCQAATSLVDRD